jgi:A/G-specific adenine glycosylase
MPTASRRPALPNAADLLAWYDRQRRDLPWRAPAGSPPPDPYAVWLSEVMLQQTTAAAVAGYFNRFRANWPTVERLAAAPDAEVMSAWAGLGYYARARNLLAAARMVAEPLKGWFPDTVEGLRELPGVGAYTAAAIAAIAFERPVVPVDGNVERVTSRLFRVTSPIPAARPEIGRLISGVAPSSRHGDFAQALMDLGATICTPRKPTCALCPWRAACAAFAAGDMEDFPVKAAKAARPTRHGIAYVARRADGAILLGRRPDKGLLGGMTEVPTTTWAETLPVAAPPLAASWRRLPGVVVHVFTHFRLELAVERADVALTTAAPDGFWWSSPNALPGEALPTVMRKAVIHADSAALPKRRQG